MVEPPPNENAEKKKDQGQGQEHIKVSFQQFVKDLRKYIVNLLNVQEDIDRPGAVESIKKDVEFKGFNVWILICSIIICSVGLNLNSTAVIIGAMLISPLMGPITGIGFAVATFDHSLWVKSIKNLLNTVVISVITSFLFFKVWPEGSNSSELLARTNPTILDLLVALFGGIAGILASTRRIKTNVIPGVAIATALMPPLCTAGYGLATLQFNFFFGAIYLFFINSVFISLAALIIVRYLKFQPVTYINREVQRKARNIILISVAIISVPSVILYYRAMKETLFKQRAMKFLNTEIMDNTHWFSDPHLILTDSQNIIRLYVYGKEITAEEKEYLDRTMSNYKLENTRLIIENMGEAGLEKIREEMAQGEVMHQDAVMNELRLQIAGQNQEIVRLRDTIQHIHSKEIDLKMLLAEIRVQYTCVSYVDYGLINRFENENENENEKQKQKQNENKAEVLTFFVAWNNSCTRKQQLETLEKLKAWITVKYGNRFEKIEVEELTAAR